MIRTTILAIAIFSISAYSTPVLADSDNCLQSCPKGSPGANKTVSRTLYSLSHNPTTKFADWVAYKVNKDNFKKAKRGRNWVTDPDLDPGNTITPPEYDHASVALGVDRGHQAPLGSFKSHTEWATTNYLSNITPQFTKLNQGVWKKLEDAIRKLAKKKDKNIYVVTGPLYEWPMAKFPATDKNHRVPSAYWKVIALKDGGGTKVAGFYFYQDTPKRAVFCDHLKTVDFIEEKAKLDFFSGLNKEAKIEAGPPTLAKDLGCKGPLG